MAEGAGDREQELAALHRSYRNMENDRQKYSEESQNIIKRQRQAIEKIRKENERLKEQLKAESQQNAAIRRELSERHCGPPGGVRAVPAED